MNSISTVVIGGGPAGLTAAYELSKHGKKSVVFEKADRAGGISRTETYKGYRFDIGGHRFFTKVGEVEQLWQEVMGEEFIKVPQQSSTACQGNSSIDNISSKLSRSVFQNLTNDFNNLFCRL